MSSSRRRPVAARLLGPLLLALSILPWLGAGGAAAAPLYPHQSQGNRGADVKAIQGLLRHDGERLAIDGIYGASTTAAVKVFQSSHGLTADGQVGETTWVKLVVRLATGSTGEAVKALQRQLNAKRRAGLTVSGVYGAATRRAVVAFQGHVHLSQTGVAGPLTWRYLIAHFQRPLFGSKLCDYQVGNGLADWGTGAAIGQLTAAAAGVVALGRGRVAVGDIGFEFGGDIPGHESHEHGLDVDVRPMRRDETQCSNRTNYRLSTYSRAATRDLIKAIRAAAPGHVKLIYFNDPVLIREGLTTWHTGHDDHLHIRYCERVYPIAAYRC
jgi:peptidoglycan hydrolase-like protein with peptidoglycan-binding domain